MAATLTSRVTLRVPTRARAVSSRASRAAVVRVAADADGYKAMNVTKPNIVNNLDGETTRNIDGKHQVFGTVVEGEDVVMAVNEVGTGGFAGTPKERVVIVDAGEIP